MVQRNAPTCNVYEAATCSGIGRKTDVGHVFVMGSSRLYAHYRNGSHDLACLENPAKNLAKAHTFDGHCMLGNTWHTTHMND